MQKRSVQRGSPEVTRGYIYATPLPYSCREGASVPHVPLSCCAVVQRGGATHH